MLKIILPTCGAECLLNLYKGLYTHAPAIPMEVIVVANEDGRQCAEEKRRARNVTAGMLEWWPVKYLEFPNRIGYVRAIDWGWKLADPSPDDLVAVLNDDVVIEGDWITPLVEALQQYPNAQVGPRVMVVGPNGLGYQLPASETGFGRVYNRDGFVTASYTPGGHYHYAEGWCWMVRAETIVRAFGIVDLGFEGTYCEDCDLSIRIQESGGQVVQTHAPIRHIGHGSQSPEMMVQWKKNRQYLAEKWDLRNGGRRSGPPQSGR